MDSDAQDEERKQSLINEQIIEKGYNPEDLSNFISRTKGIQMDKITSNELQRIIEQFKNERLKLPSALYVSKKKSIRDSNDDILYQAYSRITNCSKPIATPLSQFKSLDTVITEEDKDIKSTKTLQYTVSTKELNTAVNRLYSDFEWLRAQLSEEYPTVLIPPLPETPVFTKQDPAFFSMRLRYLNKFISALIRKKTLRTSELLYIFLSMKAEDFNTYRLGLVNKKVIPKLQSKDGTIDLAVNKDLINHIRSFKKHIEPCTVLSKKLNQSLQTILNDYTVLSNHLKDASDLYFQLNDQCKLSQQGERVQKVLRTMGNLFKCYSGAYAKQRDLINCEYKELFDYLNMELSQIVPLIKDFKEKKGNYKALELKLNAKKESYFNDKKFSKWDIIPKKDEVIDYTALEKDKEAAFNKMFTKETKESLSLKEQLALSMKTLLENYRKMVKYHEERIKIHFEGVQNRNKELVADAYNIIGLINFKL